MNLTVDVGNTKTKIALFRADELLSVTSLFNNQKEEIINTIKSFSYKYSIILFSADDDQRLLTLLKSSSKCTHLTERTKIPISIAYSTKETLGKDRIAATCGAYKFKPNQDNLVVTTGTCLTYNFLSKENKFLGGSISPGIYMRYQAMNYFTDKLPLVDNKDFDGLIGRSTEESLLSGVRQGIIAEMDGIIHQYQLLYPNLKVFICGGDTSFFVNRLKSKIFADQYLVLRGLNTILLHNI